MSGSPREDFDPFADYGELTAENASDELDEITEGDHNLAAEFPGEGHDLRSDDYDSFENSGYLFATTPPNRRAQVRFKDKKRNLQAKIVAAKSSLQRQEVEIRSAGRKTSVPLRLLEFGGGGESSDTESINEPTNTSMAETNARRKRETRMRNNERSTKADLNPFGEQELASSGESMTVDTASRFRCLNQTLATKRAADCAPLATSKSLKLPPLHMSPSVASLNVPKDRFEFHRTFTMLISLGNVARKEKDVPERYIRQLSSEQEMWRSSLSDVIWLELQARLHQRSVEEHDTALCIARQNVTLTLQHVLDFHVATPSVDADVCGCDSSKSRWCRMSRSRYGVCLCGAIIVQEAVLEQVTALLQELEAAESLYPTQKALASQHIIYTTDYFQRHVGTLCLWLNITIDITRMLILVAKIISVESIENTPWACLDLDRLQHMLMIVKKLSPSGETMAVYNYADSNGSEDEDDYTEEEEEEEEEEEGEENTTSNDLTASNSLSASAGKKRVCFDDQPTEIGQPEPSRILNGTTDGDVRLAAPYCRSSGENPTFIYRHYVDRTLKKTGLKKLRLRLKELVDGTLQRTRLALLRPKELTPAETNTALTHGQFSAEEVELLSVHGVWSPQFESMGLPSFKPTYLFLVHVLLDVIHECLKLRLEQRPRSEPSLLSLRPLICECKEILNAAVIMKQYYLHMVSPVAAGIDFENNMDAYEDTLQQMLEVYFNYIQAWMNGLQQLPEMSKRLKNFLEEEWNFTKRVCPHVRGGEANAGKRFCVMASSLLRSISDFLETGIDDCVNQLYDIQSAELSPELEKSPSFNTYSPEILLRRNHKLRQDITKTCRKFKENFHEARERSSKALGFAKMLRKDLEVAAEFRVNVPLSDLFTTLQMTNHIRVKAPHGTNYQMFIPEAIVNSHKRILQLLNVTCGREDISVTSDPQVEGYLLLVNCDGAGDGDDVGGPRWDGREVGMELTAETTIALVHIEVDGLLFVVIHSAQLMDQRREFQQLLQNDITLINDQKSCHKHIADSMMELKNSALDLRKRVAKAIKQVDDKLNPMELSEMAEAEKDVMQKLFCETLHQCYNFGFEYHKEVTRLVSGEMRGRLSKALVKFAKQWMKFVMEKCERGRGRRPRWACHGLDFLSVACELRVLVTLTDEQFEELKKSINDCITHIIGDKVPVSIQTPAFRVSSPDVTKQMKMMRHTSMPDTTRTAPKPPRFSLSEPTTPFTNSSLNTKKSVSSTGIPTIADQDDDGGIMFEVHDDSKVTNLERLGTESRLSVVSPNLQHQISDKSSHLETMMQEIRKVECDRQAYLRKQNLIGRPTNQRLEDYRINIRGVTFRWQRGIKIGEGQFGKVYTAVNIDTGVLMAMKEMPLQPNDHQAIRTLVDEIKIFEGILHPSLVHYYGVELHRDEMIIFMEYCQNGTIADLARQESMEGGRMGLSEGMIRKYTSEILTAIHILHENAIVHRDIKGANVFLTPDGHVKLGDFGCSAKLKNHTTMPGELKPGVGTPAYMAPEVIANSQDGVGRAADIWGLACVIIEMATGKRPWPEMESKFQIMFHVGMGNSPPVPAFLSEEGKDFLSHCFEIDPQQRWTASRLKDHQFVMVDDEEP